MNLWIISVLFGLERILYMAKPTELVISPREITGKATKQLRKAGIIPANVSGRGEEPQAVQVEAAAFEGLRRSHHATGMISLKFDDAKKNQTALIRYVQREPRSGKILHIDFFRVNLGDQITARVPLHFVETAPGVKIEGGSLLHLIEALEIGCAAGDIVDAIEVDVSSLEHIEDMLHAKDVKLPANYILLTDPEEPIVKVTPPRAEKGKAVAEAPAAAEAPAQEAATPDTRA
jgi:large subunit ribosomal protein L25